MREAGTPQRECYSEMVKSLRRQTDSEDLKAG